MLKKEAIEITGGLSLPSKMPGCSYNLPAQVCITGSKMRSVPGSVCSKCYACKGRYLFKNVKVALNKRLLSIVDPLWVDAMALLISSSGSTWFRWHDSGDLSSEDHLKQIFRVCEKTPEINHWLPTLERGIVRRVLAKEKAPSNLTIRFSSPMVDKPVAGNIPGVVTSAVITTESGKPAGHVCSATVSTSSCDESGCRACWSKDVSMIYYMKH